VATSAEEDALKEEAATLKLEFKKDPALTSYRESSRKPTPFRARVVLEVLSGQRSASEAARQHKLKPELISRWKDIAPTRRARRAPSRDETSKDRVLIGRTSGRDARPLHEPGLKGSGRSAYRAALWSPSERAERPPRRRRVSERRDAPGDFAGPAAYHAGHGPR
jgi:transposase-like protein